MSGEPTKTAGDVIRTAARAFERDRYLTALLAPTPARDGLLALAAFAGELRRIAPMVSEPMIGHIRLQWWRDAIASDQPTGHPIADAVARARTVHALPAAPLIAMIDAHEQDLSSDPPNDDAALLAYLDATDGALFALASDIVAPGSNLAPAVAAGRAYGLARLLLDIPAVHAQGRTLIPVARVARAGLAIDRLFSGETASELAHLAAELIGLARDQLAACRVALDTAPHMQKAALLPLALVEPYLTVVEQRGGEVGRVASDVSPFRRVWSLWRASRSGHL